MENFALSAGIFLFFVVNLWIVISDLKTKRIPNRLLLAILLLFCVKLIFLNKGFPIFHLDWWLGLLLAFSVGFGIYILHGWAPGDAKYFIILSFFLPSSFDIVRFIGNISTISVVGILFIALFKLIKKNDQHLQAPIESKKGKENSRKRFLEEKWKDVMYFSIPFLGFYLSTIFFREFLYGNINTFRGIGIDIAIILFFGLLIIRYTQKWLKLERSTITYKKILVIVVSIIPIIYGFLQKGMALWYYVRDIIIYGIPTIVLVSLALHYGTRLIQFQEREKKAYADLNDSEVPLFLITNGKFYKVNNRKDVEEICSQYGQVLNDAQIIVNRASPFGHYIFLSFIITASTSIHLASSVIQQWFRLLSNIWEFFRQFI